MSNPTDPAERDDDDSPFAPKWLRDPNRSDRQQTQRLAAGEFSDGSADAPRRDDDGRRPLDVVDGRGSVRPAWPPTEPPPRAEQASNDDDLPRMRRPPRVGRELQPASAARRPRADAERPQRQEPPPGHADQMVAQLRSQHSLDPVIIGQPRRARRTGGRLAAITGFILAATAGAAIALFVTGNFPSEWRKARDVVTDATSFMSRFGGETAKTVEQPSPAAPRSVVGAADPQPVGDDASRAAPVRVAAPTAPLAPAVRGVTDNEIRFGISAPFTGAAKELGNQMKLGIETAFNAINDAGGIHGRQLKLFAADDGYEPARTVETMKDLYEKSTVFGFVGNVGTPTAAVALPYALEKKSLFFGAFTGAGLLRRDPPDRYVFNYRASYAEETDAVVRYLVKMRRLKPEQIAVFAQQDSYGDAGFSGVAKAIRALRGGDEGAILRLDYKRNTIDVDDAVTRLRAHRGPIKAVVMVASYRAAAKFIEKTRDVYPSMIFTNVSFVGSTALAEELRLLGPRYTKGVIVTQVVPAVDSYASLILKYKSALAAYFPGVSPDYVSLEGYVAASVLMEAVKRTGPQLDTETLVGGLESLREFDMGLGTPIAFGPTEHQASHKVWGTQLDADGHYQALELQ